MRSGDKRKLQADVWLVRAQDTCSRVLSYTQRKLRQTTSGVHQCPGYLLALSTTVPLSAIIMALD